MIRCIFFGFLAEKRDEFNTVNFNAHLLHFLLSFIILNCYMFCRGSIFPRPLNINLFNFLSCRLLKVAGNGWNHRFLKKKNKKQRSVSMAWALKLPLTDEVIESGLVQDFDASLSGIGQELGAGAYSMRYVEDKTSMLFLVLMFI